MKQMYKKDTIYIWEVWRVKLAIILYSFQFNTELQCKPVPLRSEELV